MKLKLLIVVGVFGFILGNIWNYPYRILISELYGSSYGKHVYLCDSAMRSHFIAKSQLLELKDERSLSNLKQSEVALLDCQKYDLLRKKLLMLGLSDDDLSYISLKYIEENAKDLKEVTKTHEISY